MENTFRELIYKIHDQDCNQKYGDNLPYSFHLKCVEAQGDKFKYLIEHFEYGNQNNRFASGFTSHELIQLALTSHDIIEDGRLTYNDVKDLGKEYLHNSIGGEMLADIVYYVTDEKGKNRGERKNEKYYKELKENKLAVFVKLSDLSANTLYSKLMGSSMYDKYKKEFPKFKEMVYLEEYKDFFDYLENI